jgi:hypothetical protein
MSDELRAEVTDVFCTLTGLPDIERVIQRGRDPVTARFTLHLADGTKVTVGTIETLWSRPSSPRSWPSPPGASSAPSSPPTGATPSAR